VIHVRKPNITSQKSQKSKPKNNYELLNDQILTSFPKVPILITFDGIEVIFS
jgi:hypothetical protein